MSPTPQKLESALENGALTLRFQPWINLWTDELIGVEALVRLADESELPAESFLPTSGAHRLMPRLGRWVLEACCRQMVAWDEAGLKALKMAVNISLAELKEPGWIEGVGALMDRYGLSPNRFEFEFSERVFRHETPAFAKRLEALYTMGVTLVMDDFGTGCSSLGLLKRYRFGKLKIDGSFIHGMREDEVDRAIVRASVGLAHTMGMRVAAEEVETLSQRTELSLMGCDEIAGNVYAPPLEAEKIQQMLRTF